MKAARNIPRLDPARSIVARLGGEAVVKDITQVSGSTPYVWQYPRENGGTGGTIPQRHHRKMLDYAKQNKIALKAEDFLPESRP
jgi:hypothetical protein